MVDLALLPPRASRRPDGYFPDLVPARPAAVFLYAQGRQSWRVPGKSGSCTADVSDRSHGHHGTAQAGGEVTRQLAVIHLVGNGLLLWLGYYWLGIGESRASALIWSAAVLVAVV